MKNKHKKNKFWVGRTNKTEFLFLGNLKETLNIKQTHKSVFVLKEKQRRVTAPLKVVIFWCVVLWWHIERVEEGVREESHE